jgi:hypothetical protein
MLAKNQLQHVPSSIFANHRRNTAAISTHAATFRMASHLSEPNLEVAAYINTTAINPKPRGFAFQLNRISPRTK